MLAAAGSSASKDIKRKWRLQFRVCGLCELLSELFKKVEASSCVAVEEFKFPYWVNMLINKVYPI